MMMKAYFAALCALVLSAPASAATMLFDFGNTARQTPGGWNNVVPATTTLFALFDSDGNIVPGDAGFEITDTFFQTGEPSQLGSEAPVGDAAAYPVSATDDYFFGHIGPFSGADDNQLGQFKLFNLDPMLSYDFTFFASRQVVADIRDAQYTVRGANSQSGVLNASNNNSEVIRFTGIIPDANNEIFVDVEPGPNNNNSNGFYYIGLMQVDSAVVPEPSTFSLFAIFLLGTVIRRKSRC